MRAWSAGHSDVAAPSSIRGSKREIGTIALSVQSHVGKGSGDTVYLRRTRVGNRSLDIGRQVYNQFSIHHKVVIGSFEVQCKHLFNK